MLRYEIKYYVNNSMLDALRNRLLPFVKFDPYTKTSIEGLHQYTVRSIYYDTPAMEFYYEKMEGLEDRNKFRIRGYNEFKEDNIVFLEIKKKLGNRIKKQRAILPVMQLKTLLRTGEVENFVSNSKKFPNAIDDAKRFMFHYYKNSLRPVTLISYDREAYVGKFDPDIRITFDKNVRSTIYPRLDELYNEGRSQRINPFLFILEIKYSNNMPVWARSIVEEFKLSHQAISKYSTGIDLHHNNTIRMSPIGFSRVSDYV